MLKNFLHIYKAIKVVINSFKFKAFKNKSLVLTNVKITYSNNILNIISIFVKAIIKLQAENYPTIYYIISEVYKIYNKLENFKKEFKVSLFLNSSYIIINIILIFNRTKHLQIQLIRE
jgi:hypothetical protein